MISEPISQDRLIRFNYNFKLNIGKILHQLLHILLETIFCWILRCRKNKKLVWKTKINIFVGIACFCPNLLQNWSKRSLNISAIADFVNMLIINIGLPLIGNSDIPPVVTNYLWTYQEVIYPYWPTMLKISDFSCMFFLFKYSCAKT